MKRIFVTGGHFSPAKAVIDELQRRGGWEIFYVGRKFALEDDRAVALEFRELSHLSYLRYLNITAGRLQRKFFVRPGQSVAALLKTIVGLMQAFWWAGRFRPAVILSFGGYVALPVILSGWLWGIPTVTHEQTAAAGLANRIIALFADRILLSQEGSRAFFPPEKTAVVGNPIRDEISNVQIKNKRYRKRGHPTIYITGGNLGAHVINSAIEEVLEELLRKYTLIHQTGEAREFGDYERLAARAAKLPESLLPRYHLAKFFSGREAAEILRQADLVVSRCGANTLTELLYLGKPAILIPIPWAEGNEQEKNARVLLDLGMAEILPQKELSGEILRKKIEEMLADIDAYRRRGREGKKLVRVGAAKEITEEIEKLVREKQ